VAGWYHPADDSAPREEGGPLPDYQTNVAITMQAEAVREENMKRWVLPFAQLVVGLAMIPQAFMSGVFLLQLLRDWYPEPYTWAMLASSVSVDAAAIICLIAAAVLIHKPSQRGVRLAVAGTICYWFYVAAHLEMILAVGMGLQELTLLDALDYLIAVIATAVAVAVYFAFHHKTQEGLNDAS